METAKFDSARNAQTAEAAEMIQLTIDGRRVRVARGGTVLEAARRAGIHIPTLCFLKDINEIGACRVCLVEVKGGKALQASCVLPATEGMEVQTSTPAVREARRAVVELLLSNHPLECPTCQRNTSCELQSLAGDLGIREIGYPGERTKLPVDTSTPSIVRDPNKCVLCRRCISMCQKVQGVSILGASGRGFNTVIGPAFGEDLAQMPCAMCGQCVNVCPVAALREKDDTGVAWRALADPEKVVVVQTAPAVRAALGEEFGLPVGSLVTGKMVAALRRLGFDRVFDTDFSADLTIMEEGHELLERLGQGGKLPLITSCSPGWVKFCEHYFPKLLPNLSTAKSPQQMFGAVAKTYYAQKTGIDPARMFVVSVMPCTAKKYEAGRPEMNSSGYRDVDAVLTTRELARMLRQSGIDFASLPEEEFDDPLGVGTGAGVIFGTTGGVMEAALRTVYEVVTGRELPGLEFAPARGTGRIKEAEVNLDGKIVKVAIAHGLGAARELLEKVTRGEAHYHFIEIMACSGGCVGGGGQPILTAARRWENDFRVDRGEALYRQDRKLALRKSHENPVVKKLYEEFLGAPLGEKAHHLLHTHYQERGKYPAEVKSK